MIILIIQPIITIIFIKKWISIISVYMPTMIVLFLVKIFHSIYINNIIISNNTNIINIIINIIYFYFINNNNNYFLTLLYYCLI